MSLEENKALLCRYYQVFFNEANLAAGEALHTAGSIFHEGNNPPIVPQEYMRRNAVFLSAFPDRIVTIDFQVAEGGKGGSARPRTALIAATCRAFRPRPRK